MLHRGHLTGTAKAVGPLIASGLMVGCAGGNHSNPTLAITHANVSGNQAILDLEVTNPSGNDLALTGIDYSLIYGPLPVADGSWSGTRDLPKGSTAKLTLSIPFDSLPLDTSASTINLAGEMSLTDASASGNMQIEAASFDATSPVTH